MYDQVVKSYYQPIPKNPHDCNNFKHCFDIYTCVITNAEATLAMNSMPSMVTRIELSQNRFWAIIIAATHKIINPHIADINT